MSDADNLDPVRLWREWYVKSEKAWSDTLSEMMGDERFSRGMGRYVHEALHTHRMFCESMGQYLANLNIPSRSDILDMGDRLAQMQETLNQVQVELREQRAQLARLASGGGDKPSLTRPARTRRPDTKSTP
jgi:hypothetical protein